MKTTKNFTIWVIAGNVIFCIIQKSYYMENIITFIF